MSTIKTYTPFTLEHFMQALQSLKDEMLMYYIDEAVAIYCRLRGGSVGPRPASSKNYSRGYADAFEAANYAIFTVSQKTAPTTLRKARSGHISSGLWKTP